MAVLDIYGDHWDIVLRGDWHLPESYGGETFRWVSSNALLLASTFVPAHQRLTIELEPGPGVTVHPFELIVFDEAGAKLAHETFEGRKTMSLDLTSAKPAVRALRLFAPGGGNRVGADVRILDFRVFRIGLEPVETDVLSLESGCRIGAGWHGIESFEGTSFRWVDNDARIIVGDTEVAELELELEPGPGVGMEPFELEVRYDRGDVVRSFLIEDRTRIAVPLPAGDERPHEIVLHASAGGLSTPGDERVLNFRAFTVEP